jgi:hypothetical protein
MREAAEVVMQARGLHVVGADRCLDDRECLRVPALGVFEVTRVLADDAQIVQQRRRVRIHRTERALGIVKRLQEACPRRRVLATMQQDGSEAAMRLHPDAIEHVTCGQRRHDRDRLFGAGAGWVEVAEQPLRL